MKGKWSTYVTNLAIGIALIMMSYTTLPGHCWNSNTYYSCRDAVYPPTNLQIGDVDCTLDSNSYNDDVLAVQGTWYSGIWPQYCKGNTTGCYVAYDCPDEYNVVLSYFQFSDLVTWQVANQVTDCNSCGN